MSIIRLALFVILALVMSSCVSYVDDGPFEVGGIKTVGGISKSGGPEILYSLTEQQVNDLFPIGMSRDTVHQNYGKPFASNTINRDNKVLYLDIYQHHVFSGKDTSGTFTYRKSSIHRIVNLSISYDEKNLISHTKFSRSQTVMTQIDTETKTREATDQEIEQSLGPVQKIVPVEGYSRLADNNDNGESVITEDISETWKLGLKVSTVSHASKVKGVIVDDVLDGSLASKRGIKVGDIITKLNNKNILNFDDFANKLQEIKTTQALSVRVLTKGKPRTVVFESIKKSADL